jgi:hypothetical protein
MDVPWFRVRPLVFRPLVFRPLVFPPGFSPLPSPDDPGEINRVDWIASGPQRNSHYGFQTVL